MSGISRFFLYQSVRQRSLKNCFSLFDFEFKFAKIFVIEYLLRAISYPESRRLALRIVDTGSRLLDIFSAAFIRRIADSRNVDAGSHSL